MWLIAADKMSRSPGIFEINLECQISNFSDFDRN